MDRLYWNVAGMVSIVCLSCAQVPGDMPKPKSFTIAMIPDTQNYVDYSHQMNEGFAIDAADLFVEQLAWVAERARSKGGDIAFVASVGDTWQHGTKRPSTRRIVQTAGLLFQRGSIRDAQSKWRVGAGPVTAAL
jgi:hypothetical protein